MSIIRELYPRIVNNPIITREVTARLRRSSSFIQLFFILTLTTYFILTMWSETTRVGYYNPSGGLGAFLLLTNVQYFLIFILVPLFTATTINVEKERATWDILRTSPINIGSILAGKLMGAMLYIWLCLASLAPIVAICVPLGGLSPGFVIQSFFSLTLWVIIVASAGIYSSSVSKRTTEAITQTYMWLFLLFIIIPAVMSFVIARIGWSNQVHLVFLVSPIFMQYLEFLKSMGIPFFGGFWMPFNSEIAFYALHCLLMLGFVCFLLLLACYYASRPERVRKKKNPKPTQDKSLGVTTNSALKPYGRFTVFQKEMRDYFINHKWRAGFSVFGFFFISGLATYVIFRHPFPSRYEFMSGLYWVLLPMFILPYASNLLRTEKDQDTLDILVTTTMPPWKIFIGKWLSAMTISLVHFVAYASIWYATASIRFGFESFIDSKWPLFLALFPFSIIYVSALIISIALYASTQFKSTNNTYMFAFFFGLSIVTGWWVVFFPNEFSSHLGAILSPLILYNHYATFEYSVWIKYFLIQLTLMSIASFFLLYQSSTKLDLLFYKLNKV